MKNILLIEDNPDDVELTLLSLQKSNVSNAILNLSDGAQAVEYLKSGELPALVLLDLNLPKLSGLEVLRHIRGTARTKRLPVIIFTSSLDQRDMIDAYSLGINGYIEKPIVFSELGQAVARVGLTWVISDIHDACAQLKAELTSANLTELEQAKAEVERLKDESQQLNKIYLALGADYDKQYAELAGFLNSGQAKENMRLKAELAQANDDRVRLQLEVDEHWMPTVNKLLLSAERYRAILLKIADVTSALETNRTASYRDWEMREMARAALDGSEK